MTRPSLVLSLLCMLSVIAVATPATAALRPGDIVANEPTIHGEIVVLDPITRTVRHLTSGGFLPSYQSRMALDGGGNLIVVAENKILRVDPSTGAQKIVSSGGLLQTARGLALAADGGLIVSNLGDYPNGVPSIIRVDPMTGAQALISSGGSLHSPRSLSLDAQGGILVTSAANGTTPGAILRVDPVTGAQSIAFSGGLIRSPSDLCYDLNGQIYVIDSTAAAGSCPEEACGRILRVEPATGQQTLVSSGGQLTNPQAIEVASDGALLVTDYYAFNSFGPRLLRIDPATGTQAVFSSRFGSIADVLVVPGLPEPPWPVCGDDRIDQPSESCDGPAKGSCPGGCNADCTCFAGLRPGDAVLVDTIYRGVFRIDRATGDRTVLSSMEIGHGPLFESPQGLAMEPDGRILVADPSLAALFEVDPWTGDRRIVASDPPHGFPYPRTTFRAKDVALDAAGRVFVGEYAFPSLQEVDLSNGARTIRSSSAVGTGPNLRSPTAVLVETDGRILLSGDVHAGIFRIDPATGNRSYASGGYYPYATGTGPAFMSPAGIAPDLPSGFLVADLGDGLGRGATLISADRVTGDRALISGCRDYYASPCPIRGEGPIFISPRGVAREPEGSVLVGDLYLDAVFRVDRASGDRAMISAAGVGAGTELLGPWDIEIVPADLDSDADGMPDDGDGSGSVGDHPCAPGQSAGCDDNCRLVANVGQENFDGDGPGDACDADDDNDGLSDTLEISCGRNPLAADSDGDGVSDGSDPNLVARAIDELPDGAFRSPGGHRHAIANDLRRAGRAVAAGDPERALTDLRVLLRRLDGCGEAPDPNDWIIDCGAQASLRELFDLLLENLSSWAFGAGLD